ncbi:MAG: hypothetical protein WCG51_00860, partial [Elusimicrobiota bacterium]
WTGERKYIINRLLKGLIKRCRERALVSGANDASPVMRVTAYITSLIMNYIHTGRYRRKK